MGGFYFGHWARVLLRVFGPRGVVGFGFVVLVIRFSVLSKQKPKGLCCNF